MSNSQTTESFEVGARVPAGQYECAACGYRVHIRGNAELPVCPRDNGLHSIKAWQTADSDSSIEDDCSTGRDDPHQRPR